MCYGEMGPVSYGEWTGQFSVSADNERRSRKRVRISHSQFLFSVSVGFVKVGLSKKLRKIKSICKYLLLLYSHSSRDKQRGCVGYDPPGAVDSSNTFEKRHEIDVGRARAPCRSQCVLAHDF